MTRSSNHGGLAAAGLASLLLALAPNLAHAAGPGVHGRVLGHDEKGAFLGIVAGAKIEFQSRGGGTAAQTTSDKDGYYKVNLPPGEYLYKIQAAGYRNEEAGRGMRLEQNHGYAIFNLGLTKGQTDPSHKPPPPPAKRMGKLHGRVLEKTQRELPGIPDARIVLRREGSLETVTVYSRGKDAPSQQTGNYETTLEAGVYRASVTAAGFERLVDPQLIDIQQGQDTNRDFVLSRQKPEESAGQGIRGLVTIVDSVRTPPPIQVKIVPLGVAEPPHLDVQVASNGAFTHDLAPGRYRVVASAAGFGDESSPPEFVLGGRYTVVNLALHAPRVPEPKTNLEVFVFTRVPGQQQPLPLSGASVSLVKAGASPLTARTGTTDNTGHTIFPVNEAGQYVAEAHLAGYRAGSASGAVALGQTHEVGIELVKEATPPAELALMVLVHDALTKRPLSGARVLARHAEQTLAEAARGSTDARGMVTLRVPGAGSYSVLAQALGYEPGGSRIDVAAQPTNQVAIGLKPIVPATAGPVEPVKPAEDQTLPGGQPDTIPHALSGFVAWRDASGQLAAVPGAKLTWQRVAPAQPPLARYANSGSSGRFEIGILPGTYLVRVEPPAGFEGVTEQVEIAPTTSEKYFLVHRLDGRTPVQPPNERTPIKGVVVEEMPSGRFAGVTGAEITFLHTGGTTSAQSGTGGGFGLQLAPNAYQVHIRARGYEPLDTQAEIAAGMTPLRFVLKPIDRSPSGFALTLHVVERSSIAMAGRFTPVPAAQVQVLGGSAGKLDSMTNGAGQYSIRVQPGRYTIRVGKAGYEPASASIAVVDRDVTQQIVLVREAGVQPGRETHQPTLTVRVTRRMQQPPLTIAAAGAALPGAQVTIMRGASPVASGMTSGAGIFSTELPTGSYSVKVSAAGYAPAGQVVSLTDRDAHLDFQLQPLDGGATRRVTPGDDFRRRLQPFGQGAGLQSGTKSFGQYVIEYRINKMSPWTELGRYDSRQAAQAALAQATERGRLPRTAEVHITMAAR